MATLREYFDADFEYCVKIRLKFSVAGEDVDGRMLCDFAGFNAFMALYVTGTVRPLEFFQRLLEAAQFGSRAAPGSQASFANEVYLPSGRLFGAGSIQIENKEKVSLSAEFPGDPERVRLDDMTSSTRIFVYTETPLTAHDMEVIRARGQELNQRVLFRTPKYAEARSLLEKPLAFISHDSRDKDAVARIIENKLQTMMCPVWYDEFSLKVGSNLRESIEHGLKTCRRCILVLSKSFFSNRGWTKKEFDSIYTREIIERQQVVLPVWCGVSRQEVYDYCASLPNVTGLDWDKLGSETVCKLLAEAILYPPTPLA